MNRKPFLVELAELIVAHWATLGTRRRRWLRAFFPTPGNVLFILLAIAGLLWAQSAGALPMGRTVSAPLQAATTINYQGQQADASSNPLDGTVSLTFAIYDAATGGNVIWGPETRTGRRCRTGCSAWSWGQYNY